MFRIDSGRLPVTGADEEKNGRPVLYVSKPHRYLESSLQNSILVLTVPSSRRMIAISCVVMISPSTSVQPGLIFLHSGWRISKFITNRHPIQTT
ncbi:hypothetical protein PNOK_0373000 [Pyrrhoderma noxium]|uniref:Uncharacterized protein n=1 Tax=Pyrrhoderma noxium TaxID=2282107 RepID=A0A286UNC9_9AGAM|nr:hypothetical protein PNOK_0373000 [Pyrrhoderma noxium]